MEAIIKKALKEAANWQEYSDIELWNLKTRQELIDIVVEKITKQTLDELNKLVNENKRLEQAEVDLWQIIRYHNNKVKIEFEFTPHYGNVFYFAKMTVGKDINLVTQGRNLYKRLQFFTNKLKEIYKDKIYTYEDFLNLNDFYTYITEFRESINPSFSVKSVQEKYTEYNKAFKEEEEIGLDRSEKPKSTKVAIELLSTICDHYLHGEIGDFIKIEPSDEFQR